MDEKLIPEWLLRLRTANGTEDEPNTDERINYFKMPKKESLTINEYIAERMRVSNPYDDDDDDDDLIDESLFKIPKRRTPLDDMLEGRNCDTLYIKCNVDGDPVVRSHKDLLKYGDPTIKKLFDSHSGLIRTHKTENARKIMSCRRVLVYDVDPVCVALYCVAFDGLNERILRVTVDENYKTELIDEKDDGIVAEVFKLYSDAKN